MYVSILLSVLACAYATLPYIPEPPNSGKTGLDVYAWAEDNHYGWVDMGDEYVIKGKGLITHRDVGWTGYLLNMTSQQWLTPEAFANNSESGSVWWHMLMVIVPEEIKYKNNASLYITGTSMNYVPNKKSEDVKLAAALAVTTGMVTGCLFQIPEEKVIFSDDPTQKSRGEDAIIAYTWAHYLKTAPEDAEWLLRYPMVKASLRAMDTITDFMKTKFPDEGTDLQYYTVAGASKRGWTTWDVGAVDQTGRVVAIVPIVLDAINFIQVMHHQYASYNGWSWALQDYIDEDIFSSLDHPNMKSLAMNVDPYYYRNRLTMPKLIVNAVLDEFQQPDDTHYWFSEMPEPKHFLMTPNAEHSEATGILEVVPAIAAFMQQHLDKKPVPEFTWTINEETGEIVTTLNGEGQVKEARVWYAYSCGNNPDGVKRRDFRIINLDDPCKCGVKAQGRCLNLKSFWTPKTLQEEIVDGKRTYRAHFDAPDDGRYVAYMIDIVYAKDDEDAKHPLEKKSKGKWWDKLKDKVEKELKEKVMHEIEEHIPGFIPQDLAGRLQFTTEVSIFPNTFPYPGCGINDGVDTGIICGKQLV
jgi:PhoPQ-activated pathogenicity-related protein